MPCAELVWAATWWIRQGRDGGDDIRQGATIRDRGGKVRMVKEGSEEEDRHGETSAWHDALRVCRSEIRAVTKDKASSVRENLSLATYDINVTLSVSGKEEE